ncbi:hypothetical protein OESDEN_00120 [Oesophagostomum dentatum]|uniref:Uncharacterized protein n=1 Tax=Oesophagostomum dentatum TaxID=61180 RepID=A0A0B1TWS6_OESDE|nr:hypothetical protein OESDEN_00120 [Oesophagostomum dentatum]
MIASWKFHSHEEGTLQVDLEVIQRHDSCGDRAKEGGEGVTSYQTCASWPAKFKNGDYSLADAERSDRPMEVVQVWIGVLGLPQWHVINA